MVLNTVVSQADLRGFIKVEVNLKNPIFKVGANDIADFMENSQHLPIGCQNIGHESADSFAFRYLTKIAQQE